MKAGANYLSLVRTETKSSLIEFTHSHNWLIFTVNASEGNCRTRDLRATGDPLGRRRTRQSESSQPRTRRYEVKRVDLRSHATYRV